MTDASNENSTGQGRSRIVVGVDGSPASIGALHRGIRMAKALDADVLAVAAWSYPPMYGGSPSTAWSPEQDAVDILTSVKKDIFGDDIPDWFIAEVRQGSPAQVLLEASEGAEMLVVGSRGHGGFAGLLLGSVSSNVAEYAKCPVLIYHDESNVHLHE
jgi:nucleotide-binding universal stress UspA family protein